MIGGWVSQCLGDLPDAELRLEEADHLARGVWRPLTQVWLGGLRVHQGRCAEGVALINPTTINEGVGGAGYPALHAPPLHLSRVGQPGSGGRGAASRGRARRGGRADGDGSLGGPGRQHPGLQILRGLGARGVAREANERGLELSAAIAMAEPMAHAHLDLAAAAVSRRPRRRDREVAAAHPVGRPMRWPGATAAGPPVRGGDRARPR